MCVSEGVFNIPGGIFRQDNLTRVHICSVASEL